MAAGEIVVSLLAKTGSFDTDIQRSTKAAERRMKEMKESASQWGAAVGAAFVAAGAGGVYMAKQLIDGIDALNDVADATGSTVEKISALEDAALRTGTSMDTVSSALVKFNSSLSKADGKDDVSKALKAIGLEAGELKRMDPADALQKTAIALSKFADDGDKARLVQELFGKSVAEVAPLLKDLAEKGELVATVTTEQAKQAEAFNKELFALQKNATDMGRVMASDLVTGINAAAKAFRESGLIEGLKTLFGGTAEFKSNKKFSDLTNDLLVAQNNLTKMQAAEKNPLMFGAGASVAKWSAEVKRLESELARMSADRGFGEMNEGEARRLAGRGASPSVGPLPDKKPKGPDPDADFKSYLNNLQQQLQKTNELTVSEKLLDDIRRGSLTVSDEQKKQLAGLAAMVDKEKELTAAMKDRMADGRSAAMAQGDAVTKANEEYQAFIARMKEGGPAAQLEKQRDEMTKWAQALTDGAITQAEYIDGVTGKLGLVGEKAAETKSMTEELGMVFSSAFEDAILGGGDLSDVFKGLLQDIARVILRMQVMEPMMKQIKGAMDGGGGGGGFNWGGLIGGMFGGGGDGGSAGAALSGARAAGGPVNAMGTYLVGERGPELFTPRTAGAIVPNHALGGGGDKITVVNQTTGRVDRVIEQRISATERALIIQEAVKQAGNQFGDPNSHGSRVLSRNYRLERTR